MRGAIALLAACATTPAPPPKGGPRGLRASEHMDVARQHADIARHAPQWPEPRFDAPNTATVPWHRSWDSGAEHERIATAHRDQAVALEAEFDEACAGREPDEIRTSPLARYALGGSPTQTGAILFLSPGAGPPEHLLADIRCHRAWMMLAPSRNMDDCPLDLPGITLDASGDTDGIVVTITTRDNVDELQRRVARELELHHHRMER
jgi:hypothetical protein